MVSGLKNPCHPSIRQTSKSKRSLDTDTSVSSLGRTTLRLELMKGSSWEVLIMLFATTGGQALPWRAQFPLKKSFVDLFMAAHHAFKGELFFGAAARTVRKCGHTIGIHGKSNCLPRNQLWGVGWHDKTSHANGYGFLVAADSGSDHRQCRCHGFQQHIGEAFCLRGANVHVHGSKG